MSIKNIESGPNYVLQSKDVSRNNIVCNWQFSSNFDHRPNVLYSSYFTTFLLLILGKIVTDDKQGHKLYTIDFVRSTDRCKDILMIYAGLIDHSCARKLDDVK